MARELELLSEKRVTNVGKIVFFLSKKNCLLKKAVFFYITKFVARQQKGEFGIVFWGKGVDAVGYVDSRSPQINQLVSYRPIHQ